MEASDQLISVTENDEFVNSAFIESRVPFSAIDYCHYYQHQHYQNVRTMIRIFDAIASPGRNIQSPVPFAFGVYQAFPTHRQTILLSLSSTMSQIQRQVLAMREISNAKIETSDLCTFARLCPKLQPSTVDDPTHFTC